MSLIECLCYIALSAIICTVLFRWWAFAHEQIVIMQRKAESATQARLIYQLMMRDIAQASPFIQHWNIAADNSLYFQIGQEHISYRLKGGILMRKYQKSGAKKAAKGMLARGVKRASWQIMQNGLMVTHLMVHLQWEDELQMNWRFPLRTGMRS